MKVKKGLIRNRKCMMKLEECRLKAKECPFGMEKCLLRIPCQIRVEEFTKLIKKQNLTYHFNPM
jgi:hypothetical protein